MKNSLCNQFQLLVMLTREKWKKNILLFLLHIGITSNFGTDPFRQKPGQFQKATKTFQTLRFPFVLKVAPQASSPLSFYTEVTENSSKVERKNEDLSSKRSYMIDPDWYNPIWTELFLKAKPLSIAPIGSWCSAASDIKKYQSTVKRKCVPNVIVKTTITIVKLLITPYSSWTLS